MNRDELQKALDATPALDILPDSKAVEQLQDLLAHPGLPHLWGLLQGSKIAQFQVLANSPLTNMETVSRASVIQGTIKGVDLIYNTLLEQAVPSQADQGAD